MARQTTTYNYTGAQQDYVVPEGVVELAIKIYGAAGGQFHDDTTLRSKGGHIRGILPVTPGETLHLFIGSYPGIDNRIGGWNGGGDGGLHTETNRDFDGCGGGGAADIRRGGTALSDRIVVAGGGGGSTGRDNDATPPEGVRRGGHGGANTGERGDGQSGVDGGFGGTDQDGGQHSGALGVGGNGHAGTTTAEGFTGSGGGGGGGYYGGGGGGDGIIDSFSNATNGRGGGGGSNYTGALSVVEQNSRGVLNVGDARIQLTPNSKPTVTITDPVADGTVTVPRPTFRWNYSDPEDDAQKAYRVKVFTEAQHDGGGFNPDTTTATFDSGKTFSASADHRFSGNLTNNTVYWVYVKVWETDVGGLGGTGGTESSSPWVGHRFTVTNQAPVVDITAPTGVVQDTSQPIATWDYTDAEGDPQKSIWLYLYEGDETESQPLSQGYIWQVIEETTQTSKELPALNNGIYTLRARATQVFGDWIIFSAWVHETFTIDIPPPPVPNITADYDPLTATITVNAENTGGSPTTEEMDIQYFDPVTNSWREVRNYPNPIVTDGNQAIPPVVDYEYVPNIQNKYRARARYFDDVTGNTYVSAWGEVAITPVQEEWWLKNLSDPSLNTEVYPNGTQLQIKKPRDMAFFEPLGRKHKLAVKSISRGDEFPLTLDTLTQEQHDTLVAILESSIDYTLLLQSPMLSGKQWYVEVENPINRNMRNMVDPWYQFEVSFIEVSKP